MDYMKSLTQVPSTSKRRQFLIKNGGSLQQKLIATFGARYELPIHCLTAEELVKATNNFAELVFGDRDPDDGVPMFELIKGTLGDRSIIVAKHHNLFIIPSEIEEFICNVAFTSQLSHLKHVLKLVGCCLEFEYPVLVYESIRFKYLGDFLYQPNHDRLLTWRNRVKIAKDIASTIAYLHSAFPTPIIYRNLCPYNLIIDELGTPKILDFSQSISLPPGEMQVELNGLVGSSGFLDPNCFESFYISPKSDVYGIGILLLVLITGRQAMNITKWEPIDVLKYVEGYFAEDQLNKIIDCKIWEVEKGSVIKQQLEALVKLALRCTKEKGEDRPEMIDVTKELCRIEKL